jgi:hypothetical protein
MSLTNFKFKSVIPSISVPRDVTNQSFQVTKSTNGLLSLPFYLVSSHQIHQRTLEFTFYLVSSHQVHQRTLEFTLSSCFKSPSPPTDAWVYPFILFQVTKFTNGRLSLPFHLVSLTDAWVYLFILFQVTKFIESRVDSRKCLSKAEWILANLYPKPSGFSQNSYEAQWILANFYQFQVASSDKRTSRVKSINFNSVIPNLAVQVGVTNQILSPLKLS